MEPQHDIRKIATIGLVTIIAFLIPGYFLNAASQRNRELQLLVLENGQMQISLVDSTMTIEPSQTATLIPTPSNTPIPDATEAPIAILNPIPVSGHLNAFISEVVHIENGTQTMVKIRFPEKLEGFFFAKVENLWSEYDYQCFVLGENNQNLFCLGTKLTPISQATIRVFEGAVNNVNSALIFSDTFDVPFLILQPTKTKSPSTVPPPTFTPTPTNTNTPEPTKTPKPTKTLRPTRTPRPTQGW